MVMPAHAQTSAPTGSAAATAAASTAPAQAPTRTPAAREAPRDVPELLQQLQVALASRQPASYLPLVAPTADRAAAELFASSYIRPDITRAVLHERDRLPLADTPEDAGSQLVVEVFLEAGPQASILTWRLDVVRVAGTSGDTARWAIQQQTPLTFVDGLHRLTLDATKQFRVRNLRIRAEDLVLTVPSGVAFAASTAAGPTAYVVLGRGTMDFHPTPKAERGQIALFAGSETLSSPFEGVFVRLNPADVVEHLSEGALTAEAVNSRMLNRARELFEEEVVKSFGLNVEDFSADNWSLVPPQNDFLVEVRTNKLGTLTYTRSNNEPEDISLFDRRRRRTVASYASERKLLTRGPFYSEAELEDYDVRHHEIQAHLTPERQWIEARSEVTLTVRSYALATLTLRLAESLSIQSVTSHKFGRLLALKVRGQNSFIINLPVTVPRGEELKLTVVYRGRLPSQPPEREVLQQQDPSGQINTTEIVIPPESRLIYSSRSYWYPQSTVTDYATASMRLTVPEGTDCIATGAPATGNPVRLDPVRNQPARRLFVFTTSQPARYLALVVTRLPGSVTATVERTVGKDEPKGPRPNAAGEAFPVYDSLALTVASNPRQSSRMAPALAQVSAIFRVYADIVGDLPYPSFTLALVDDHLPGGHSPAYFALLHQPLPTTGFSWRNDPVSFDRYPQFFIAHELAHQFWGDAVGGENYHEQWISEGFAQYFAVLYAERTRTPETFRGILRQLRRTATTYDRYGPVWLGYRLGHLQGDSRVFRALVYNKGALVLHMLRRLLGDELFFRALRRFYAESRFLKVGTDDVRRVFEAESGRSLERFFERWILQSGIPQVAFSYHVETAPGTGGVGLQTLGAARSVDGPGVNAGGGAGSTVRLRFEQRGDVFDVPVTVTLRYASGATEDVVVHLTDRQVEHRVALKETLRSVEVNEDEAALIEIVGR